MMQITVDAKRGLDAARDISFDMQGALRPKHQYQKGEARTWRASWTPATHKTGTDRPVGNRRLQSIGGASRKSGAAINSRA